MSTTDDSEDSAVENGTNGTNGHARATLRSKVSYAAFPVQEGFKVAEAVQRAGGSEATEPEVMKAMGLTSTQSHAWSYRISSAREFGLIDRVGRGDDAKIRVTDLYMRYAHPGDDAERRAALMQIVLKPTVYGPLLARYRGAPKPDVTGLANVLWREHGIKDTMKEAAAEAFLATIEFAGLVMNGIVNNVTHGVNASTPAREETVPPAAEDIKPPADAPPPPASGMQNVEVPDTFVVYTCKIGRGKLLKIPLPREFSKAEVERLYRFLLTQVDDDDGGTP